MWKIFLETIDSNNNTVLIEVKNIQIIDELGNIKILPIDNVVAAEFADDAEKIIKNI